MVAATRPCLRWASSSMGRDRCGGRPSSSRTFVRDRPCRWMVALATEWSYPAGRRAQDPRRLDREWKDPGSGSPLAKTEWLWLDLTSAFSQRQRERLPDAQDACRRWPGAMGRRQTRWSSEYSLHFRIL